MKNVSESAVDRLIELALAEKPARRAADHDLETVPLLGEPGLPSMREVEHNPVWRALVQIGAFLPHMARVLDIGNPVQSTTALTTEVRQSMGALENAQRDLRMAVTEQTVELKRVEETMTKAQEATERHSSELVELGDDVRSMRTLVKTAVGTLVGMVVVLAGLVGYLVWKLPHLH
jgi:hypothetical protein